MTGINTAAVRAAQDESSPRWMLVERLCDEVDRLRGVIERVADLVDDGRTEDAYHVLHDALEADA